MLSHLKNLSVGHTLLTLFEAVLEDAISNYENLMTDYGGENLSKIFVNYEKMRIGVFYMYKSAE